MLISYRESLQGIFFSNERFNMDFKRPEFVISVDSVIVFIIVPRGFLLV